MNACLECEKGQKQWNTRPFMDIYQEYKEKGEDLNAGMAVSYFLEWTRHCKKCRESKLKKSLVYHCLNTFVKVLRTCQLKLQFLLQALKSFLGRS